MKPYVQEGSWQFFKVHETFPKKEKESMSTRKCSAGDNPVMIAAKLRHKDLVIWSFSFWFDDDDDLS